MSLQSRETLDDVEAESAHVKRKDKKMTLILWLLAYLLAMSAWLWWIP
jgi:hypothetical protein